MGVVVDALVDGVAVRGCVDVVVVDVVVDVVVGVVVQLEFLSSSEHD